MATGDETLEIRPARPEDAAAIVDFQIRMAIETEGLELDPSTVTRGVQAVFDDPAKGRYWVAESAGRVVGSLLTTYEWSDWRNGTVLWIQSVYVPLELRRSGVYRRLYESLRDRVLSSPDLRGIRLYVDRRNMAAQRVYERLGMSREHYEMFEWLK
ncbi:MAG TPA: GNAT family N-acetyltransferase [Thermoanaerobaculia bacterium]|nr:GNAT family N-acetyltransferase [Thermoanaerobaculia bacterium]